MSSGDVSLTLVESSTGEVLLSSVDKFSSTVELSTIVELSKTEELSTNVELSVVSGTGSTGSESELLADIMIVPLISPGLASVTPSTGYPREMLFAKADA